MIDNFIIGKLMDNEQREHFDNLGSGNGSGTGVIWSIIGLALSIWAGVLAWNCNRKSETLIRILITVLAFLFSTFYLIFYLIYHKVFLKPCE